MINKTHKQILLFFITFLALPIKTFAAYVPLTPGSIPQIGNLTSINMSNILNGLFAISIGVSAILAVIMLTIGGFKHMTSESAFKISGAKEQMTNAIVGLLIVLLSYVILYTINPEIVSLNLFI